MNKLRVANRTKNPFRHTLHGARQSDVVTVGAGVEISRRCVRGLIAVAAHRPARQPLVGGGNADQREYWLEQ